MTNISSNSLTLRRLTYGVNPTVASGGFNFDPQSQTYSWRFTIPFEPDQYLISLSDGVTDNSGRSLDGEWTNPFAVTTVNTDVSEFPSGDGTAGGSFNFVFVILPGDADLSNRVDGHDFSLYLQNVAGSGHTFMEADYNGDGYTDSQDNTIWQTYYGRNFTRLIYADFDQNGTVDSNDNVIWQQHFGQSGQVHDDGDADLNGNVNGYDYMILQRQIGFQLEWVL